MSHSYHHRNHPYQESQTYEQKVANTTLQQTPDPIHWDTNYSYRKQPYRHLNHQNGIIGHFHVRVVEAKNLERDRRHWSVLGLGVVKHLGLSNAHGEVSSFASMKLGFRFRNEDGARTCTRRRVNGRNDDAASANSNANGSTMNTTAASSTNDWQRGNIFSASASASMNNTNSNTIEYHNNNHNNNNASTSTSAHTPSHNNNKNTIYTSNNKTYKSTTIPFNSTPKWPSVQTETNNSLFDIPLNKGSMPQDGMEIILSIEMKEEITKVDSIVKNTPIIASFSGGGSSSNGGGGGNDGSLLGVGEINVTDLVLRGLNVDNMSSGSSSTGTTTCTNDRAFAAGKGVGVDVLDEWITLSSNQQNTASSNMSSASSLSSATATEGDEGDKDENGNGNGTNHGQVRLLISYEPNGLKPQKGDIIAFESFARRPNILSKCPTIVPPLHPLKIKDQKGEYILAMYEMFASYSYDIHIQQQQQHQQQQQQQQQYKDDTIGMDSGVGGIISNNSVEMNNNAISNMMSRKKKQKYGYLRIHRNSIFVIERTNLFDTAVDLSLKPTDILLSTSVGQSAADAAQPYVEAAGDILAPVLLSSRLLLEASKVGGGALAVGLKSAVVNVVENADPEKRRKAKRSSIYDN